MRILILTAVLILSSCSNKSKEFIEVYYLREGLRFPMTLGCGIPQSKPSKSDTYYYKEISDESFIRELVRLYQKPPQPTEMDHVDARINILFHHNNRVDTICMGEHWGVAVNGEMKGDYPELLALVKKEIYKYPER